MEEDFEKLQQDKRQQVKESNANPSNTKDSTEAEWKRMRNLLSFKTENGGESLGERDDLIKEYAEKLTAKKLRTLEKREFDARLASLMKKYTPNQSDGTSNA